MNVVIITGASSGIGREFALQLDAGLYTVDEFWLIARREERLEELAARGKSKTGNDVKIYISNINFEATYSYLETDTIQLSLIRIYSINSITTQDSEMFRGLKEWIQSLKKFSTLISESGEMQRIQFFKQQREIIDTL